MSRRAMARELRWALQQSTTVEEVEELVSILLDGFREATQRWQDLIDDRRKKAEAQLQEAHAFYERPAAEPKGKRGRDPYLTVQEAADHLGLARATLDKWRTSGGGPVFVKIGKGIRYNLADIDAWIAQKKRRSTSDPGEER